MSTTFVNLLKELQNRMANNVQLNGNNNHDPMKEVSARLLECLYTELTKRNNELDAREKSCQEQEKKLSMTVQQFNIAKGKIAEILTKAKQDTLTAETYREESAKKSVEIEKLTETLQKASRHIQILEDSLQKAQQQIQFLEARSVNPFIQEGIAWYGPSPKASKIEQSEKSSSESQNVPFACTLDNNSENLYMKSNQFMVPNQETHIQALEDKLNKIVLQIAKLTNQQSNPNIDSSMYKKEDKNFEGIPVHFKDICCEEIQ